MIGRKQVSRFQEWSQVYLNTIYYQIASQNFGRCTVLLEATNNWCVNISKGLLNEVILINLKKAFDMNADGTSIRFAAPTIYDDLEMMINTELANINTWLKVNNHSLNVAKTEFMTIGFRQGLQTQAEDSI